MNHFPKYRAAGRRLALERCEPRRLLSVTTVSTDDLGDASLPFFAWEGVFDLASASGAASDSAIVTNGFLPTPAGSGSIPIDSDSDLVTLGAQPRSYGEGLSLGQNTNSGFRIVLPGGFTGLDAAYGSVDLGGLDGNFGLMPTVTVDDHTPVPDVTPSSVDDATDPSVTVTVPPAGVSETPSDQPTAPSTTVLLSDALRAANDAYFLSGPVVAPLPSFDVAPTPNADDQVTVDDPADWLSVPGGGSVTPPVLNNGPTVGTADVENQSPSISTSDRDDFASGSEEKTGETTSVDEGREASPNPIVVGRKGVMERVVSRPAPVAGSDDLGAGAIDLTGLLFAEDASNATQDVGAIAHARAAVTIEDSARDAALAVESWVRAIPAPAAATKDAAVRRVPEAPAILSTTPLRRPAGSVTISLDGGRLSAADARSGDQVSGEREKPDAESSAAVRLERPNAYRYAVSALSVLLGGAVFSVARGRGSNADAGRKPGVVGRSRPGETGREIRPSCE